jgi:dolichol kinase
MNLNKVLRSSSVILPIGDAFAAVIGKRYGKIKVIK